jgi:energy-coupling factor transporter ATP-binding protein EcfA2
MATDGAAVAGMPPEAGRDLLEAVEALRRKEGFLLVIVVHRLRQVPPHGNRVLVMCEGRIVDDTRETERMLDADWLARHDGKGGVRQFQDCIFIAESREYGKVGP